MKNKIFKLLVLSFLSIFVLNMNWLDKSEKEQIKPVIEKKYMDIVDPPEIDNPGGPTIPGSLADLSSSFEDYQLLELNDSLKEDFQISTDEDYYLYECEQSDFVIFYLENYRTNYDFKIEIYKQSVDATFSLLEEINDMYSVEEAEIGIKVAAGETIGFKVTKISGGIITNAAENETMSIPMPGYYVGIKIATDYNMIKYDVFSRRIYSIKYVSTTLPGLKPPSSYMNHNKRTFEYFGEYTKPYNNQVFLPSIGELDVSKNPYRNICYLDMVDSYGTGFMVDENVVMTAAHCVFDYETDLFEQEINIFLEYNDNGPHYPEVVAKDVYIPVEYYNGTYETRFLNDYAYIVTMTNVAGERGYFGILANYYFGQNIKININIIGYPFIVELKESYGFIDGVVNNRYHFQCNVNYGMSGSPIIIEYQDGTAYPRGYYVVGIVTSVHQGHNEGEMITAQRLAFLRYLTEGA